MRKILFLGLTLLLSCSLFQAEAAGIRVSGNQEKINLVWQVKFKDMNDDFAQLPPVVGVNVVSPCWFDIINADGLIRDKGNLAYTPNVRAKGYKVWALITNSFNPELTHQLLKNKAGRAKAIERMLFYADKYQLDGYNLDFENIAGWDKDDLTSFTREITTALHAKDLTVSMDITIPSGELYWSECYDRKALGNTLDYIMVMTYDQNHPTHHRSGPNAALNWVEKNLNKTLDLIPSQKLLLGLPLYMRSWEHKNQRSYAQGRTLSMSGAEKIISDKQLTPQWDEKTGQYYFEYKDGASTFKVWQEDKNSLRLKTELVNKYALAGIASWRKGFETPDVWQEIDDALNGLEPLKITENSRKRLSRASS